MIIAFEDRNTNFSNDSFPPNFACTQVLVKELSRMMHVLSFVVCMCGMLRT